MKYQLMSFLLIFSIYRIWETFLRGKNKKIDGKVYAKGTLFFLSFAYGMGFFSSFLNLAFSKQLNQKIIYLGLFLLLISFIITNSAFHALGPYYSNNIEVRAKHPICKQGPYKVIRHPIYLAILIEQVSIILICNAAFSIIILLGIYLPLLLIRIHLEEKFLINELGNEYRLYIEKTPALIPNLLRFKT